MMRIASGPQNWAPVSPGYHADAADDEFCMGVTRLRSQGVARGLKGITYRMFSFPSGGVRSKLKRS